MIMTRWRVFPLLCAVMASAPSAPARANGVSQGRHHTAPGDEAASAPHAPVTLSYRFSPVPLEPTRAAGTSVAIDDELALVGAPFADRSQHANQGVVYALRRDGAAWASFQELSPGDGAGGDRFGTSVAISGMVAVVGAPGDDSGSGPAQGSAYVFTYDGSRWTQTAKLTSLFDAAALNEFGSAVAVDGDTILVGERGDDESGVMDAGLVHGYTRLGTAWLNTARISPPSPSFQSFFGSAIALKGDIAVIGAPFKAQNGFAQAGGAYIFRRQAGTWLEVARLEPADLRTGDSFGSGMAIEDGLVAVGAPGKDLGAATDVGAAYVYESDGSGWRQQPLLRSSTARAGDAFGQSLAIAGGTLVASSYTADVEGRADQGALAIFRLTTQGWIESQVVTADDGRPNDLFGAALAISGGNLIIGAPGADGATQQGVGAAYFATGIPLVVLFNDSFETTAP